MLMLIISGMLNDDFKNEKRKVLRVIRKVWLNILAYSEESILPFLCLKLPEYKVLCTDKKEYEIFLLYKDIQMGSVAKSYKRKGFLTYEVMCK